MTEDKSIKSIKPPGIKREKTEPLHAGFISECMFAEVGKGGKRFKVPYFFISKLWGGKNNRYEVEIPERGDYSVLVIRGGRMIAPARAQITPIDQGIIRKWLTEDDESNLKKIKMLWQKLHGEEE